MSTSALFRWLFLVAIAGLIVAAPTALADDQPTFTVTAVSAFLRDEPRVQAPATYSVFQGQVYPIIGRNGDNTWLQLDVFKATKGTWVLASVGKVTGSLGSVPVTVGNGPPKTAVATQTPASTRAAQPTPASTAGGPSEICVLLYDDANGNGALDANERAIPGGQLTLLDPGNGAVIKTYTTTAADTSGHCFKDLPAGLYTVAAVAPAGYNATMETSIRQQALAGQHYQLNFGAQPSAGTRPGGNVDFFTALLTALGLVLLMAAAGTAALVLLRRK
jgi:hypothetical protein